MSQQQSDRTLTLTRPHLVINWPDGSRTKHTLNEDSPTQIGRKPEGEMVVVPQGMSSISRQHAELRPQGDTFSITDLGSVNGIILKDRRIEDSVMLADGDEFSIGNADNGEEIRFLFVQGTQHMLRALGLSPDQAELMTMPFSGEAHDSDQPHLVISWPRGGQTIFAIDSDSILLGRHETAELRFPSNMLFISNEHARLQRSGSGFQIIDLDSTNGTRVNNQLLEPNTPLVLRDGAIIRIGDESFGVSVGLTFRDPQEAQISLEGYAATLIDATLVQEYETIDIGRDIAADIVLDSPAVSRTHARVEQTDSGYQLIDLNSANGTFVNGERVQKVSLNSGDLIQIEQFALLFQDGELSQYESQGIRLDATELTKDIRTRHGPLRILDDISLTVMPRDFVALVGGSGAGKSTLMNALIGSRPADGEVLVNGHNLYEKYDSFRSQIGFVPQSDILHTSLTVEQGLNYAARLRLPSNISANERKRRIASVLETVNMNNDTVRRTRISNLSGGQRKRVSIAAELLADPKLIFLDEATSGLDPGLEKKMMFTLRRMADEGRTIVLITHATSNITQADHVSFISQGKLVYFGPPQEALEFFEVDDFADIYERIEHHGDAWLKTFRESKPDHYQQHVVRQQATRQVVGGHIQAKEKFGIKGFIKQLSVLTQRSLSVLRSDIVSLALLLALFPLTATLQLAIATPDVLTGDLDIAADPEAAALEAEDSYIPFPDTNTFIFVMGLEAVLVGMYVPSNELIRERSVYLRERMVNLRVFPYLLSKVTLFAMFSLIQVVLYLLVLSLGVDLPKEGVFLPGPLEMGLTLFLTMMAGVGIGLFVSAISSSSDMAIYLLVILLFFQFFFAGTVFDLRDKPVEPLSYFTSTRWSLTALGVTIDMEGLAESTILCNELSEDAPPLPPGISQCFNFSEARDDLLLSYSDENLLQSWLILVGTAVLMTGITGVLVKRLDAV